MHCHMLNHNIFSRSKLLENPSDLTTEELATLAESIDTIIGQAGNLGKRRSRRRRPEWYSITLVRQRLTVSYL